MKAIIPVAGIGSRLRPHTHTQPKSLVPIAGKAILAHIIDDLIQGGIQDFVLVLGYLGSKIENFVSTNYKDIADLNISFVIQDPREGLAHALWVAKETYKDEEEILIVLGDTIARVNLSKMLESPNTILGVKKVSDPRSFGIAEINQDGTIKKLIEKPKIPKSNLALVGIYKIKHIDKFLEATEYIIDQGLKTQGEYQLTDALMKMLEMGEPMDTLLVDHWYDCGKKETLLEANAILLNQEKYIQKNTNEKHPNAIIIPPVSIGNHCTISDAIIGPNVAIGDNTIVTSSIVENSIIGSYSELNSVVLKNSIIGNDSSLKGLSQSLNIGDNTELNFNK